MLFPLLHGSAFERESQRSTLPCYASREEYVRCTLQLKKLAASSTSAGE